MKNNEPSSLNLWPFPQPKQPVQEETLTSQTVQIERKAILLTLKQNSLGRFLRISEEVGGKRNSIIIPASGLENFRSKVDEMLATSKVLRLEQSQ